MILVYNYGFRTLFNTNWYAIPNTMHAMFPLISTVEILICYDYIYQGYHVFL